MYIDSAIHGTDIQGGEPGGQAVLRPLPVVRQLIRVLLVGIVAEELLHVGLAEWQSTSARVDAIRAYVATGWDVHRDVARRLYTCTVFIEQVFRVMPCIGCRKMVAKLRPDGFASV